MSKSSHIPVIDQIETAVKELRPHFGLGPVTKCPERNALGAPLVAASDPVHPSLFAFLSEGRVYIRVEWVVAVHTLDEIGRRLTHSMRYREHRLKTAGLLLGLAAILESNRPKRASSAGWEAETGNVFVRDSFAPTKKEMSHLKERLQSLIEHACEIRHGLFAWEKLELPDAPESPLKNGFNIP